MTEAELIEPTPVVAVTCLAFEGRIAAGTGVHVVCEPDIRRLGGRIEAAIIATACCGVVSFGVAGGLDSALSPGDWVVASSIVADAFRFCVDDRWSHALLAALPGAIHADIAAVDAPVATLGAKLRLRARFGSVAVDTESHIAARVAERAGIPFAALRVVLDPAWQRLPPAALVPLRPDGTVDIAGVLRSFWRTPSQMGDVLKITADAWHALAALAAGRRRLGHRLGFTRDVMPRNEWEPADTTPLAPLRCADAPS